MSEAVLLTKSCFSLRKQDCAQSLYSITATKTFSKPRFLDVLIARCYEIVSSNILQKNQLFLVRNERN
jgi:hypothetical protein